jgi:plastocyanin
MSGMPGMSDEQMAGEVGAWFRAHPAHGEQSTAAPADSFVVEDFDFDENHDGSATQIDTARIFQGQTILFKWRNGTHTITSGTGSGDPNAGKLFNVPSDINHTVFSFQFDSIGVFPFFCQPHQFDDMRGVVVVRSPASVGPIAGGPQSAGFVAPPWPNPTRGTTSFHFSLPVAGHARAVVIDVNGRRIATALDRGLAAGTYAAAWDGRNSDGSAVRAGLYFISLEVPGATQSRRVAVLP